MRSLIFALGLLLLHSPSAYSADDINDLLNQVDSALGTKKSAPGAVETAPKADEEAPVAPRKTTKRRLLPKSEEDSGPTLGTPAVDPQVPNALAPAGSVLGESSSSPTRYTMPLDHSSLAELLKADTTARTNDLRSITQGYLLRIGGLAQGIQSGYVLTKDDDTFNLLPGTFAGVALSFQPSWYLSDIFVPDMQLRLTLSMGAGATYGEGNVVRSGIMNGNARYSFFILPVQTEVGLLMQMGKFVGAQLSYGYGVDFVNQRGNGFSDTTNALFATDQISLTARFLWDANTEFFGTWTYRGLGVLPTQTLVSGSSFKAGVGFHLGG